MPREPALLTSAGRMPERSQHRVSEGQRAPIRLSGLVDVANVRRRGMGTPSRHIGHANAGTGSADSAPRVITNPISAIIL
jgi:hypothetical protein